MNDELKRTVIASKAWQSFKLELKTNRLLRRLATRNDRTLIIKC